jgi:hypothetical protein
LWPILNQIGNGVDVIALCQKDGRLLANALQNDQRRCEDLLEWSVPVFSSECPFQKVLHDLLR